MKYKTSVVCTFAAVSLCLYICSCVHMSVHLQLCSYLNTIEDKTLRRSVGNQVCIICPNAFTQYLLCLCVCACVCVCVCVCVYWGSIFS